MSSRYDLNELTRQIDKGNALQIAVKTKTLSKEPDELLLVRLRELEKKMGLVMTLVRALSLFWNISLITLGSSKRRYGV